MGGKGSGPRHRSNTALDPPELRDCKACGIDFHATDVQQVYCKTKRCKQDRARENNEKQHRQMVAAGDRGIYGATFRPSAEHRHKHQGPRGKDKEFN
jgi:hypothetical protein